MLFFLHLESSDFHLDMFDLNLSTFILFSSSPNSLCLHTALRSHALLCWFAGSSPMLINANWGQLEFCSLTLIQTYFGFWGTGKVIIWPTGYILWSLLIESTGTTSSQVKQQHNLAFLHSTLTWLLLIEVWSSKNRKKKKRSDMSIQQFSIFASTKYCTRRLVMELQSETINHLWAGLSAALIKDLIVDCLFQVILFHYTWKGR